MTAPHHSLDHDVVVIGGGFYGACLALYLKACKLDVIILERASTLLTRASYVNQARVHNGYHYPRSIVTGARSSANFPLFNRDFGDAIVADFMKTYAIARLGSKVSANQFYQFCRRIGAPVREVGPAHRALFDADLIEAAFEVREYAFDASALREGLRRRLDVAGVPIMLNREVHRVEPRGGAPGVLLHMSDGSRIGARHVFNCTYAHINTILKQSGLALLPMKHEIAEVALVRPAPRLRGHGITVMDGPFFSTMPFPAQKLFSFTHVRYTPHYTWTESLQSQSPSAILHAGPLTSQFTPMLNDATRYIPALRDTEYRSSLFDVKTVLLDNEQNDGRPILLRRDHGMPNLHIVMGGKIDNIYDIIQALADFWPGIHSPAEGDSDTFFRELFHAV